MWTGAGRSRRCNCLMRSRSSWTCRAPSSFILGLDQAVIDQALAAKYPTDPVAQREYMSKLVQLPFHLPPLTQDDLVAYLRGLDVDFPDERCRDVFLSC